MPQFILLTIMYCPTRGGFEAVTIVQHGTYVDQYKCFFSAPETSRDHAVIKGLLADAKWQHTVKTQDSVNSDSTTQDQMHLMRSA
jgi:hypothetical protein